LIVVLIIVVEWLLLGARGAESTAAAAEDHAFLCVRLPSRRSPIPRSPAASFGAEPSMARSQVPECSPVVANLTDGPGTQSRDWGNRLVGENEVWPTCLNMVDLIIVRLRPADGVGNAE
jgi:hypothetical protein